MSNITRREFNKKISAGFLGLAAAGSGILKAESMAGESSPNVNPNFVFICSDQHSAAYTGFGGHPVVKTPNMDRIAGKGVVFSSAYCGSPLCAPGRAGMMTGMYPSDVNSFCNSTVYDGSHPTFAKRMRDSGYYCWATGKQDLNPEIDMGFVEVNVQHGHSKSPDITSLFRRPLCYRVNERGEINGEERNERHVDIEDVTTATDFFNNEAGKSNKPWLAFVGFTEPHPRWSGLGKYFNKYLEQVQAPEVSVEDIESLPLPYQAMRDFKMISTPIPEVRIKRARAAYFSMVSELDEYVGQIYDLLEKNGQLENTYFIYTSDHGETLGEHGMWLKNNLYDADAKIPLIITGPGIPQGKIISAPVSHIDLAATILELSGIKVPQKLRGISLLPLIMGDTSKAPAFVYSESHSEGNPTGSFMIRKDDWKLIHFSYYGNFLFNLKDDPGEKNNLAGDPAFKNKLVELLNILNGEVDPEEVTERAFACQEKMLKGFAERMNEEELFKLLQRRLGNGQARNFTMMLSKK